MKIKANVQNVAIGMISKFLKSHVIFFRLEIFHFDINNKDTSKPYQKLEYFVSAHH